KSIERSRVLARFNVQPGILHVCLPRVILPDKGGAPRAPAGEGLHQRGYWRMAGRARSHKKRGDEGESQATDEDARRPPARVAHEGQHREGEHDTCHAQTRSDSTPQRALPERRTLTAATRPRRAVGAVGGASGGAAYPNCRHTSAKRASCASSARRISPI